tara:strand:- start:273 stop:791 length:519 start_codon:yes stop_codon:yes gene_type:complete
MKFKKINVKCTNSTNDVAIRKIKKGNSNGAVIAEKQKKGRGTYGKKWISIKGNLFMSIFFEIKVDSQINKITKKNCYLIKKALEDLIYYKISIKPPNDLLIKGKKFCGILQETIIHDSRKFLIIGIGVNIKKSPHIKNYPTTSINEYGEKRINRNVVFTNIIRTFEKKINKI